MNYGYRERERGEGQHEGRGGNYGYGGERGSRGGRDRDEESRPEYERANRGSRSGPRSDWEGDSDRSRSGYQREEPGFYGSSGQRDEESRFGGGDEAGSLRGYGGDFRSEWQGEDRSRFSGRQGSEFGSARGQGGRTSGRYGTSGSGDWGSTNTDSDYGRSSGSGFYGGDMGRRPFERCSQQGRGPSWSGSTLGGSYGGSTMGGSYGGSYGSGRSSFGECDRSDHRGKGPKGYKRNDERIREDVSEELQNNGDVDASNIEVEVKEGEVTLRGEVQDRSQKRCAEDCIAQLPGVRDVNNQIRVKSRSSTGGSGSDEETGSSSTVPYDRPGSSSSSTSTLRQQGSQKTQKISSTNDNS